MRAAVIWIALVLTVIAMEIGLAEVMEYQAEQRPGITLEGPMPNNLNLEGLDSRQAWLIQHDLTPAHYALCENRNGVWALNFSKEATTTQQLEDLTHCEPTCETNSGIRNCQDW